MRRALSLFLIYLLLLPLNGFADTACKSPTSVPGLDQWTANTGTKVDAVTDTVGADCTGVANDGDTDYIEENTNDQYQSFDYTNFAITSASITSVSLCVTPKAIASASYYLGLRVNGSNYLSSIQTPTGSYVESCYDWTTNPDTSAAWVEADVEGTGSNPIEYMLLGADNVGVGDEIRVTQMYIKVTYTTASASGGHKLSSQGAGR